MLRDTYIEVDLDRLAHNVKTIRERVGNDVCICAVVKGDAYGHGSIESAKTIMKSGGDYLAVATLTEALELRQIYHDYRIFIMGYTSDENLKYVVKNEITQCIFTYEQAFLLDKLGREYNKKPKIHIKYDTGFNRLGFRDCKESIEKIKKIVRLENLECEGIFSHFALVNDDESKRQFYALTAAVERIESDDFKFRYKHICDSIAAIDYPEFCLNMIRPGAILYGMKSFRKNDLDIKQVMKFKTKIVYIKPLKKGEGVSYNHKYKAQRDMLLATIPVGYADGFPRNMFEVGEVTVRSLRVPVVGVICMDQCMIDVTEVEGVSVGDEVIIYGDEEENAVTFEEASYKGGTNKNELLCRITRRTPKIYIENGARIKVVNYLLPDLPKEDDEIRC